jgi:hypothetical protein
MQDVGHYLHLDHGPCGVQGPTDPVHVDGEYLKSKVEVPRKCASCNFLAVDSIHGFHCTKDHEIWGDIHRGLDWGTWQPDCIYVQLPPPKVTTKALVKLAQANDFIAFIKEHRRINPDLSLLEARNDFAHIRDVLASVRDGTSPP